MKKRYALYVVIVTTLVLTVGMQVVEVADADPFFIFHPVDPIPGTIPPGITIVSPQNNQTYYSDIIVISFNVSKPQLGTNSTAIIEVKYIIDGISTEAFSIWRQEGHSVGASSSNAVPEFDTTFTSPPLSQGNHYLTVYAEGVVYPGNLSIFFTTSSKTVNFIMGDQTTKLSPIPSQISTPKQTRLPEPTSAPNISPTATITPSPTSNQTQDSNIMLNPTVLTALATVIVVVAVASVSSVYYKRHKSNNDLVKKL